MGDPVIKLLIFGSQTFDFLVFALVVDEAVVGALHVHDSVLELLIFSLNFVDFGLVGGARSPALFSFLASLVERFGEVVSQSKHLLVHLLLNLPDWVLVDRVLYD